MRESNRQEAMGQGVVEEGAGGRESSLQTSTKEEGAKESLVKKINAKKVVKGAYDLSLGISVVVAILIGVGIGLGLRKILGWEWLLWLGVFWGVSAGVLNIYKAYKCGKKELQEMAGDIKYTYQREGAINVGAESARAEKVGIEKVREGKAGEKKAEQRGGADV